MKNNSALARFELEIEQKIVYANYRINENIINIDYVFAPEELRGLGAAGKLMEEIVKFAQDKKMKLHPICSYAVLWLKRKKEYSNLVV